MKKAAGIVAAIIVVGAAAVTAGAWYTGQRAEQEIRNYVAQINQQAAMVHIESYERGIFSSDVRYVIDTDNVAGLAGMFNDGLVLLDHLQHGPFPLRRIADAQFAPVLATSSMRFENTSATEDWFAAAGGVDPLQIHSDIGYDGGISYRLSLAPLTWEDETISLTSSAGAMSGTASADMQTLNMQGELGEVRFRANVEAPTGEPAPSQGRLLDIAFDAQYQMGRFGLYMGESKFNISQFSLETVAEAGDPLNVTLDNYALSSLVTEDEKNISGNVQYGIESIEVDDISLGRVDATLRFGKLEGQAVADIVRRYRALAPELLAELDAMPDDAESLPPKVQAFLDESLQALLSGKPTLALDPLRWTLPEGESSLRLNVALQPQVEPPPQIPALGQVASLDATLVVSRAMVIELVKRVSRLQSPGLPQDSQELDTAAVAGFEFVRQMALASGYVVEESENLVTRLSYADGKMRLNGDEMTLTDLLKKLPL